ncbi:hypothetical protein FHS95_003223 [Sphingomonas naasensis]|uniref:Uncharacterized protein n=1 Tax=Sphingomonas naasensis TaxID=1344951 RepID=A0A4S1WES1_9SPHN|nr:hypothetical protein [Sphingomonas naasensis]NIJ21520.1 hypothetical protein [Sphingomonas naasensis]TGX41528.1 hypothetical protein E5A74_12995 [Sphingomonas naasensis]
MIERFLHGLREKMEDPADYEHMTVVVPGDLDPFDRHYRFSIHIDAELRLAGFGASTGGGTLYRNVDFESEEAGEDEVVSTILDVEATDVDGARALIRLHMPELGAPAGTLVQYGDHEDRFDGQQWHLGEPRSIEEI